MEPSFEKRFAQTEPNFDINCDVQSKFLTITEIEDGFPHSDILGSKLVRSSPRLIAAYHVLHRLLAPRHPPDTLNSLDHSHYQYPSRISLSKTSCNFLDSCWTTHHCLGRQVPMAKTTKRHKRPVIQVRSLQHEECLYVHHMPKAKINQQANPKHPFLSR